MAQYTTPATLTGLFKEVYADNIQNLIPDAAKLVKIIPFVQREKETGNKYHQPVIVANEQGVTYATASAGAFELEESVSMNMQDAQVQGSQMLLRSAMSYDAAAKASNTKKAFVQATELLVENMLESITQRIEICLLHGGVGLGVANAFTSGTTTTTTIHLTAATWATGIWAGRESAKLQFYLVSNGSLVSSGANAVFVLTSVDYDNYKLLVTGTSQGITDLETALAAPVNIYFKGSNGNEMAGLAKIMQNTGTLFNINAADWALWKGNNITVTGGITFGKLLAGITKAVQRGLNEKIVVAVNPDTWAALASDLAALRRFDGSYSKQTGEMGSENLKYYGINGEIEIVSHIMVKQGELFGFPPKRCKRIGAVDVTFQSPGREGEEIFLHLPNHAGFELRVYTDQALFLETPARALYMTGFTNQVA